MKKTITVLLVAVAVVVSTATVHAKEKAGSSVREKIKQIPEIWKDPTDSGERATKETKVLSRFLETSITEYGKKAEELEKAEADYAKETAGASKAKKAEQSLKYLEERKRIVTRMLGDLEFVNGKLQEKVSVLNSVIGDMSESESRLSKAEKAAAATDQIVEGIVNIQQQNREFESQTQPDPGTSEYMQWLKDKTKLRVSFKRATGKLERAIKREVMYKQFAKGLNIGKMKTARWQAYTAELSVYLAEMEEDLRFAADMSDEYIAFVKAGRVFDDLTDVGPLTQKLSTAVGKVIDMKMPPVVDVEIGDPPPLPPIPPIGKFDADKFREQYRKKVENMFKEEPSGSGKKAAKAKDEKAKSAR